MHATVDRSPPLWVQAVASVAYLLPAVQATPQGTAESSATPLYDVVARLAALHETGTVAWLGDPGLEIACTQDTDLEGMLRNIGLGAAGVWQREGDVLLLTVAPQRPTHLPASSLPGNLIRIRAAIAALPEAIRSRLAGGRPVRGADLSPAGRDLFRRLVAEQVSVGD